MFCWRPHTARDICHYWRQILSGLFFLFSFTLAIGGGRDLEARREGWVPSFLQLLWEIVSPCSQPTQIIGEGRWESGPEF